MITVLHRGGMPKWLQYYIGGGSLGTPKSDYVICARPLNVNTSNSGSVMNIFRRPRIFILCELLHSFPALFLCGKGLTSERCNNVTMLHCIFPLLHSWPQTIAPVICQSNCGAGWHSSCHWQIQRQNNDGDLVMGKIQRPDRRSNPTKTARCTPFGPQ